MSVLSEYSCIDIHVLRESAGRVTNSAMASFTRSRTAALISLSAIATLALGLGLGIGLQDVALHSLQCAGRHPR